MDFCEKSNVECTKMNYISDGHCHFTIYESLKEKQKCTFNAWLINCYKLYYISSSAKSAIEPVLFGRNCQGSIPNF